MRHQSWSDSKVEGPLFQHTRGIHTQQLRHNLCPGPEASESLHVQEDQHFYSVEYMHLGAQKIWNGVPGFTAEKLEAPMPKYFPDLFSEHPDLHKLVM